MKKASDNFPDILRERGFKVTPARLAILNLLATTNIPLSAARITRNLIDQVDKVTIYRTLESLLETGVIRKVDFEHSHAHYELIEGKKHHHHLVCKGCGAVEDIDSCSIEKLEKNIIKNSASFKKITHHSLEFFGLCKKCEK